MTVTHHWYAKGFLAVFNKEVDFAADDIKIALAESGYTPNQDTHDYFNDVTNEVSDGNYVAGGATLANASIDNAENVIKLDGDDPSWADSTITAAYAIIYDSTPGTAETNPLLTWIDFDGDESSSDGTFTVNFHANGIASITPADATGFPA